MAFLNPPKRPISRPALIAETMVLLFLGFWYYVFSIYKPANQCARMIKRLSREVDRVELQNAAEALVRKYPIGPARTISESEQPEAVRKVMKSLGLSEAVLSDDELLVAGLCPLLPQAALALMES